MKKYPHYIQEGKRTAKYSEHDLTFVFFCFVLGDTCIEKNLEDIYQNVNIAHFWIAWLQKIFASLLFMQIYVCI